MVHVTLRILKDVHDDGAPGGTLALLGRPVATVDADGDAAWVRGVGHADARLRLRSGCPCISAGSTVTVPLVDEAALTAAEDDDRLEVVAVERLTAVERAKLAEVDDLRARTAVELAEAGRLWLLARELADARREAEEAHTRFEAAVKALTQEKSWSVRSQEEAADPAALLDVRALPQGGKRVHFFAALTRLVTNYTYMQLQAQASRANGRYEVIDDDRGFRFKSRASLDKFLSNLAVLPIS